MNEYKPDILQVRDPVTGEFVPIAAIKGDKGDVGPEGKQGPKGDPGEVTQADFDREIASLSEQIVQSDWNENDPQNPAFVKNRICYTKDPIESEWLQETDVVGDGIQVSPWSKEVKPLTKYKVIIDGVESIIESSYNTIEIAGWAIGNILTTPFFMPADLGEGTSLVGILPEGAKKVSIQEIYEEPVKLPEKYLPEKILTPVGKRTPEGGEIFNNYINNVASGDDSHAEGYETTASGEVSHAEGNQTTASGDDSHAEGVRTTASNLTSHAEGYETTASGDDSHAEGNGTTASGYYSHAEGNGTTASGDSQHVQGRENIKDTSNRYAHIVGNGKHPHFSNAHTLDWDGNSWYQGSVLVGGKDMDAPDAELNSTSVVIKSSTPGSAKRFRITVDDSGAIKAEEIVPTV